MIFRSKGLSGQRLAPFYYVVRYDAGRGPLPLPRQSLNWTTIAYLLWDDLEPDELDEEQKVALVDWLHFGGQLILSGPDCLDKLKSSFLKDYLPAQFKSSRNLTADDLAELNEHWAVPVRNSPGQTHKMKINESTKLLGVEFDPHEDASYLTNTGELAIERQIGRGRIVATSFSLDDQSVITWPSFQSFFNGCLLRKSGRRFGKNQDELLMFAWLNDDASILDPMLGSTVRYISRDLSADRGTRLNSNVRIDVDDDEFALNPSMRNYVERYRLSDQPNQEKRNLDDQWHYGGFQNDEVAGNAGWNDYSGISVAARDTLKEAAGITPPSSTFVLKMLAVYLAVLVPLNWAVFRLIGRVEWAWIAAPFIAIGGAFTVAKMASLDIGFVRSNSQVGIMEMHAGYSRAHISQYSALYTSLSTGYDLELDNLTAQSLPFPSGRAKRETMAAVTMRRTNVNQMEGFQIQSNTTGMLHTENDAPS